MTASEPLKVLIGVPFGERMGGAENVLLALLAERAGAGIDARVWLRSDGGFRDEIEALGVEVTIAGAGIARAVGHVAAVTRAWRPDALLSWLPRAHVITALAALRTATTARAVAWQHTVPEGNWRHRLAFALPCAGIIAISDASAVAQRAMRPRRPVRVVRTGLPEPDRITPEERIALRRRLGVDDGRPVLGIVGRLLATKGQEQLVAALPLLAVAGHDCHLLVIGGEDPRDHDGADARLRAQVDASGLADRVALVGQVPDAKPYVQALDVLVSASASEGLPVTFVEAMALGVPIVAVANTGQREAIEQGVSGLLVADNSPAALAGGIGGLLSDAALAARLVAGGRQRYESQFTAAKMARDAAAALRATVLSGSGA